MRLVLIVCVVGLQAFAPGCGQAPVDPTISVDPISPMQPNRGGMTLSTLDVSYTIEFVPANATRAEVQLLRDGEVVRTFPAPMEAGRNTVSLPPGLPMGNPSEVIGIKVASPAGEFGESSGIRIYELNHIQDRDLTARARFERVVPSLITSTPSPQSVTIAGTDLQPLSALNVGGEIMDATFVDGGLRVEVPSDHFGTPGFLNITPHYRSSVGPLPPSQQLTLAVADPALPSPGGLAGATVRSVEAVAGLSGDELIVRGGGFDAGMQVVLGRGTTPVSALSTAFRDPTSLTASLIPPGPADDYFIAILSADKKSLSRPFPIASSDALRPARPPAGAASEPEMPRPGFRVRGDLVWNRAEPQWFYLEGPVARPGLRVQLDRDGEQAVVEAEADTPAAAPGKYPVVRVPVPSAFTSKAVHTIVVVLHTK